MRNIIIIAITQLIAISSLYANEPTQVHENVRKTPYPQSYHTLYINPAPLLVPKEMRESDYLQFNLSQDEKFAKGEIILSKPQPWYMFNPHRILQEGTWYWRVRSVSKLGEDMPWSDVFSFRITSDIPQFYSPPFEQFLNGIPQNGSKLYGYLEQNIKKSKENIRSHPEFGEMVTQARAALSANYATDTVPYKHVSQLATHCDNLYTAYVLTEREIYAEKMVKHVRWLLAANPTEKTLNNDFISGELVYLLATTYETCSKYFTEKEKEQIEGIILQVLEKYYYTKILGHEETHIFDNHFWQFTFRHFLQGALVLYDKYPMAKEYLEYSYELWTTRAPASGFNRDGNWHNGTCYFSANAVTLHYIAMLFSHFTGVNFMEHPWYKNVGKSMVYSWMPESMSVGFGDGHEQMNDKPLKIRSAFADFIARETGNKYASWYSSINNLYLLDTELRLYRMTTSLQRPDAELPKDAPKAVWFQDSGEMIANSNMHDSKNNLNLSFRSSPFGSGSHTHSNQNAFNLHYKGAPVYRSVGYYLNFSDPHNLLSYRHTRAHNTILVDGIGQAFTTEAYGDIVRMFNGENISYALGDASNAYGGISEYSNWKQNFADQKLEQSPENGFGKTPLRLFRRHIFLLNPDIILIYDELEASKDVKWDWLLHSPTRFEINELNSSLVTKDEKKEFCSSAQIFSKNEFNISQDNSFIAPPDIKKAIRGEALDQQWSLTASFTACKANRILTIIQVKENSKEIIELDSTEKLIPVGDWQIEAELNTSKPASLYIHNAKNKATFSYGKKEATLGNQKYKSANASNSVIYDNIDGVWQVQEKQDRITPITGSKPKNK